MANEEIAERSLLARLETQPRVRDFLAQAVATGRASHAYLFLGAPGSGKLDAAWALAQQLICEEGGCGACDACIRVARQTHPDVHYFAPESAVGYLIDQVRDLLAEVALSPIRAKRKVYIIDRAEQLRANTANALLKTLEEPPANVVFILLGPSADTILPTIVSRCQCVPFRMVSQTRAAQLVERATGVSPERARMAVAVAGSPARATEFLKSAERQAVRREMLRQIDYLPRTDEADILMSVVDQKWRKETKSDDRRNAPRDLMAIIGAPLDEVKSAQEKILDRDSEYLTRGALKQLEDRFKRELSHRERSGIMEALACVRSLLRDVLLRLQGVDEPIVNEDVSEMVDRLCATATVAGVTAALDVVAQTEQRLARNVTPQLALEVMLLDIRKALTCP